MGFFTENVVKALLTGIYKCSKCGSRMEFEDDDHSSLICPNCGHSIDIDDYDHENEDYETLYPTKEDVLGYEEDDEDESETYDEVYGELDDD